jgi:hypothetical protein
MGRGQRRRLWAIGALAVGIWWLRGIEARGMTLDALARARRASSNT